MNPNKTQDKILIYLKMNGPKTAPALAKAFGMTGEGMRLHLVKLEEEGFIQSAPLVKGVGRPSIEYSLTNKSLQRFPNNHASLTVQLLKNIKQVLGQEALDTLVKSKREADYARYAEEIEPIEGVEGKLKKFTEARTREGYMAELQQDETGWLFIENHCPICSAAASCDGFCQSEIDNIKRLIGDTMTVERDDHAASGDRRCVYRIKPI
ncbi:MAG: transcriptional regulator [Bacteroidales bacterium]|nr:transcriptional regulator [Bacteroidales bacterium]